jgi:polar amino acid transport system substrate-binding protein
MAAVAGFAIVVGACNGAGSPTQAPTAASATPGPSVMVSATASAAASPLASVAASAAASTTGVQAPSAIAAAGKLVFCSDISFPPMESYDSNSQPVGADIDIGNAVAAQMGVTAEFDQTGFDGIIAALLSNKCDLVISGMNDTTEREKSIDFVHYGKSGSVFLVPAGNPLGLHTELDVCGHTAGGQVGSTNYDVVTQVNKQCVAAGKTPIDVVAFKEDPLGVTALVTGRIDAYETDAAPAIYYISKNPKIEVGVDNIEPLYIAMGLRKNDPLKAAVQQAINNLNADGTLTTILTKWGLGKYTIPVGG